MKNVKSNSASVTATRAPRSVSTRSTRSSRVMPSVRSVASMPTNSYTLISPKGKIYVTDNLTSFGARFNLDPSTLSKLFRKVRSSHKGWTAQLG